MSFMRLLQKASNFWGILVVIIALAMNLFFASLSYSLDFPPMHVKIGIFDYDQFYGLDENGNHYGYGYEYLEALSRYGKFEFEFVQCTWRDCLEQLRNGQIDIMDSLPLATLAGDDVFISKYPTGISYGKLYVSEDNKTISFNNFPAMNGMIVGFIYGSSRNDEFRRFSAKNNFNTVNYYYRSAEELVQALEKGEVDGIVSSNLRKGNNEKAVARFAPTSFYMGISKSRPELYYAINYAQEQLLIDNPTFESVLYDKYYAEDRSILILTKEEQDFLNDLPPIRIVYDSFWAPFESYNPKTDNVEGINADILKLIAEKTGLQFDFLHGNSYEECMVLVGNKQVDMLLSYDSNPRKAAEIGMALSDTFLSTPISIIGKSYNITPDSVFAIPSIYPVTYNFAKEHFPENTIILKNNIEECYAAIEAGEADFTMENFYAVTDVIQSGAYGGLLVSSLVALMDKFSFAFRTDIDPLLINIFNKAISTISDADLNSLLLHYTTNRPPELSLAFFFNNYKGPLLAIGIFVVVLIIFILSWIIFIQRKNKKALWDMAYIDPLTGASNLYKFKIDAQNILLQNPHARFICSKVDVENFKLINEIYGFAQGDNIIKGMAEVIRKYTDLSRETFCRVSSDQFVILKSYGHFDESVGVREQFERTLDQLGLNLGCLIKYKYGRYYLEQGESDIASVLEKVNYAHSLAKTMPDIASCNYDNSVRQLAIQQKMIENKMEDALRNGHFHLFLQPKYYLENESIAGAEALVRWVDDQKIDVIFPGKFIPLFEKNGFITKLDMHMLDQACKTIRAWIDNGIDPVVISVNFSRLHLANTDFVKQLCQTTDRHGIPRKYIEVELTESTMFNNEEVLISFLAELHEAGFMLSMDDFGTGYSSLGLLKNIPVDVVKIDRSFFIDSHDTMRARTVIENVIKMAHELNILIVAEGVETLDIILLLRDLNCDIVQGYYYAKPMPASDFTTYLMLARRGEAKQS